MCQGGEEAEEKKGWLKGAVPLVARRAVPCATSEELAGSLWNCCGALWDPPATRQEGYTTYP